MTVGYVWLRNLKNLLHLHVDVLVVLGKFGYRSFIIICVYNIENHVISPNKQLLELLVGSFSIKFVIMVSEWLWPSDLMDGFHKNHGSFLG